MPPLSVLSSCSSKEDSLSSVRSTILVRSSRSFCRFRMVSVVSSDLESASWSEALSSTSSATRVLRSWFSSLVLDMYLRYPLWNCSIDLSMRAMDLKNALEGVSGLIFCFFRSSSFGHTRLSISSFIFRSRFSSSIVMSLLPVPLLAPLVASTEPAIQSFCFWIRTSALKVMRWLTSCSSLTDLSRSVMRLIPVISIAGCAERPSVFPFRFPFPPKASASTKASMSSAFHVAASASSSA
mmetsp:Transcript_3842/g.8747  ORF Transcript_3842/g.8747 Transcript_3842/m.8747 type:complete len:239 (+) Transcript_3842:1955-2671(+)